MANSHVHRLLILCVIMMTSKLTLSFNRITLSHLMQRTTTKMVMSSPPKTSSTFSGISSWFSSASEDSFVIPPEYARGRQLTEVLIESPSINSRKISASMILDTTMENVWNILTDYDNLAVHVPNLVKSQLLPSPTKGGIRLFQEGAQKIIGFTFRASLVMDMVEEPEDLSRALRERNLHFKLAESQMFSAFDGTWKIRTHSRSREYDPSVQGYVYKYKTQLTYSVFVKPRGPVPVAALEWRIREDIPINLMAVKIAAEKRAALAASVGERDAESGDLSDGSDFDCATNDGFSTLQQGWGADETLAAYIAVDASASKTGAAGLPSAGKVGGSGAKRKLW